MKRVIQHNERISANDLSLFLQSQSTTIEKNITTFIVFDDSLSKEEQVALQTLSDSLFHSFSKVKHHLYKEEIDLFYQQFYEMWLYPNLSLLTNARLQTFSFILWKSMLPLILKMKTNKVMPVISSIQEILSHLMATYNEQVHLSKEQSLSHSGLSLKQTFKHTTLIEEIDELLIRSNGMNDLIHILKHCEKLLGFNRSSFYSYIPWSKEVHGVIGAEPAKMESIKEPLHALKPLKTAMLTKKPVFIKNPSQYLDEKYIKWFNIKSFFIIPVFDRTFYGWLIFDNIGEELEFKPEMINILEKVGDRIGIYLTRCDKEFSTEPHLHITEREMNVLHLLAEGCNNKEIAELLHLSEHTVKDYISNLMVKFDAKNRAQIVAIGFRKGYVK
ncbi:hypothetical protein CEW92_11600 [Bacillaceae bacterium SAS-127]|nr:hypothetical protein CEW92_11600 [Bacillaceae bacterium SAS-127]